MSHLSLYFCSFPLPLASLSSISSSFPLVHPPPTSHTHKICGIQNIGPWSRRLGWPQTQVVDGRCGKWDSLPNLKEKRKKKNEKKNKRKRRKKMIERFFISN
jgi:hypothetical protein